MDPILWTPWRMPYLRGEDKKNYDGCVFCIKSTTENDAAEYVVARSEHVFVALNMYPYNNGHLLIVPYAHVPSLENLPPATLTDLMLTVNKSLAALRKVYSPHAFNVGANIGSAAGAGIAEHFHVHIVPRWNADTNFMTISAGTRVIPDVLDATYKALKDAWDS
jgi:ATP adenylyltransferase